MIRGKQYSGPCEGCKTRGEAERFEKMVRAKCKEDCLELLEMKREIERNKTVRALIENHRCELTGGRSITLDEAYDLVMKKPIANMAGEAYSRNRKNGWLDFVAYMKNKYPDVVLLSDVKKSHCEDYVGYLLLNGKFNKQVEYSFCRVYRTKQKLRRGANARSGKVSFTFESGGRLLAPQTVRLVRGFCSWVFKNLEEEAGLLKNPWNNVHVPASVKLPREIFTKKELELIWHGLESDEFCKPLFITAANTGLTEGDICMMKWENVDWENGFYRAKRRKTGVDINIPLLPEMLDFLKEQHKKTGSGEFIYPEHAAEYQRGNKVSQHVKNFLNRLNIRNTKTVDGHCAVSVKDLHSMRHVFCYRARKAGIPETTIQKFVGHAVLEMTKHYSDHDTDAEIRGELIEKLPPLLLGETGESRQDTTSERSTQPTREELMRRIRELEEQLRMKN